MGTAGLKCKYTVELTAETTRKLRQISLDTETPIKALLTEYVTYMVDYNSGKPKRKEVKKNG